MSRVPYASAVGSLMYSMVCTRLDLVYEATLESCELGATISAMDWRLGMVFQRLKIEKPRILQGYVDAYYAGDLDQEDLRCAMCSQ